MKPTDDSAESLDRVVLDSGSGSNFRWILIVVCIIFLTLGIFLPVSAAQSNTLSAGKNSAYMPKSRISGEVSPNPAIKQQVSKLKGYVYSPDGGLLPKLTITFTNRATGLSETYHTSGKFTVPIQNGSYDVRIRDGKGHISRYSDIIVESDTSIKFSFSNYPEPVKPVVVPTPPKPTPNPTVTPDKDDKDSGGDSDRKDGDKKDGGGSGGDRGNNSRDPDDTGGNSDDDEADSGFANDVNANVDQNSNSNTVANVNSNTERNTESEDNNSSVNSENGFISRLISFVTENPIKVIITILAALILASLAVFGIPTAAAISAFAGSLLGGLGLAGKTDAVDDEVQCTLYSTPEVREGSDLLVQVFAHLLEQADDLEELATMLDPEAKKQLSKSLKQRIKRDSVLTFKLMIPGIEFEEDEQDMVWRGEPDSVEFIVPIPADHGDGNRFGRVFVYQNGEELGKIPFRITIVSKAKPIAIEKTEPSAQGFMTQNETAFVSYASKDKEHVYRFVQLMDVLKYDYHIDVFSIEAGDRWENKLYEFIDTDDVFLLFWSESASQSEWVIREAKRAEERAKSDPNSLPRIIIYRLDEKISIPEWLQEFHVDRKWAGMIANIKEKSATTGGASLP